MANTCSHSARTSASGLWRLCRLHSAKAPGASLTSRRGGGAP
jgi:hypothetical protein